MGKNLKVFLGLLLILLTASFCSSKKSSNNGAAALLLLGGGSSSSSSGGGSGTPQKIDLASSFGGADTNSIRDAIVVKSSSALTAATNNIIGNVEVSPALTTANEWTKLSSSISKYSLPKGVKLTFGINVTASSTITNNDVVEIGTHTSDGSGENVTIGFGDAKTGPANGNGTGSLVVTAAGSIDAVIAAAIIAKKALASRSDIHFVDLKAKLNTLASKTDSAGSDLNTAITTALVGIADTSITQTSVSNEISGAKAAAKPDSKPAPPSGAASVTVGTFSNQSVTVTLTNAKFNTLTSANVTATVVTDVANIGTMAASGAATVSVFR